VKPLLQKKPFDVICFFTPSGIKSLYDNVPGFKQNGLVLGAFGSNTIRAVEERGLQLEIAAPTPKAPSMVAALDQFLATATRKK
jgi:uroporphyrinogen-III synthase